MITTTMMMAALMMTIYEDDNGDDEAGASFQLFLGRPKFFFIFQFHWTIEKLEKTALYM